MAVQARLVPSLTFPAPDVAVSVRPVRAVFALPRSPLASRSTTALGLAGCSFKGSSFFLVSRNSNQPKYGHKSHTFTVRCEQSAKESNGLDVWLGRFAMVGFAIAIATEVSTGRGLLENLGLTTPLPTLALAVTALVGVLTAFFIFQSASRD